MSSLERRDFQRYLAEERSFVHCRPAHDPIRDTALREDPLHDARQNGHEVYQDEVVKASGERVGEYQWVCLERDRTIMGWIKCDYLHPAPGSEGHHGHGHGHHPHGNHTHGEAAAPARDLGVPLLQGPEAEGARPLPLPTPGRARAGRPRSLPGGGRLASPAALTARAALPPSPAAAAGGRRRPPRRGWGSLRPHGRHPGGRQVLPPPAPAPPALQVEEAPVDPHQSLQDRDQDGWFCRALKCIATVLAYATLAAPILGIGAAVIGAVGQGMSRAYETYRADRRLRTHWTDWLSGCTITVEDVRRRLGEDDVRVKALLKTYNEMRDLLQPYTSDSGGCCTIGRRWLAAKETLDTFEKLVGDFHRDFALLPSSVRDPGVPV